MEDFKYIVGELNSRFLFANYSTPQAKERGQNSKQIEDSVQVGVFTNEGCRLFPLEDSRDALKLLSTKKQTFQGLAQDGVYVYSPVANMNK